ncbi:MAG TPA: hypothetical protein VF746_01100 [Longimicrobium sp.]
MLCSACRELPPEIRRHPGPGSQAVPPGRLRALVCERCGRMAGFAGEPPSLLDTLMRLERAGLGVAGPLLAARRPHPGPA